MKFLVDRITLSVRGVMGVGKSHFTAKFLSEIISEDESVHVWIRPVKMADTEPVYRKYLGSRLIVHDKNLIPVYLEKLRDEVVVIEDAPSWLASKSRFAMEALISSYARANNTLSVIVTQKPQALPTHLTFELDKNGKHYYWRAVEGRRVTEWFDWTGYRLDNVPKIFFEGVKGKEVGRRGRPIEKESFRQRVFAFLERGMTVSELIEKYPARAWTIYCYASAWRRMKRLEREMVRKRVLKPNINIYKEDLDISKGRSKRKTEVVAIVRG